MNYARYLFLGVLLTFLSAWLGLMFIPNAQLRGLSPVKKDDSATVYPRSYSEIELVGRGVYQAEGCVYCHTQQVRGGTYVADMERGWGPRRSQPVDYIHDYPLLLGTMRTGPDLLNIGARQPSEAWHYKHLYDPQSTAPGSIMPPYRFLFETRKIVLQKSVEAVEVADVPAAEQVLPTDRARALVAYLKSLDRTYEVRP